MSKKNLLNESQVRQFMKLAKLEPLAPGFVTGLSESTEEVEEVRTPRPPNDDMQGERGRGHSGSSYTLEEESVDEGYGMEYRDDEDDMDMEPDMEPEPEMDAAPAEPEEVSDEKTLSVADVVSAITAALEELSGQPVEASIDGEDVDEEPVDVEGDMDMDVEEPMGDEEMALEEVADTDEVTTESAEEEVTTESAEEEVTTESAEEEVTTESETPTDELVEQITKKVAARILKSALTKK